MWLQPQPSKNVYWALFETQLKERDASCLCHMHWPCAIGIVMSIMVYQPSQI